MLEVEVAQPSLHRGLAVGGCPGCAQPAIGARAKTQGTLALFVKYKIIIDEMTPSAAPFRRFVVVNARPDGVNGRELGAVRLLDGEKHLTPIRIKPVPRLTPARPAACRSRRRRTSCCSGSGVPGPWMDEFVRQAHLGTWRLSPGRLAHALAF